MSRLACFLIAVLLAGTFSGQPARADEAADCLRGKGEVQISGCTKIIESGKLNGGPISRKNLAVAYNQRGNAHDDKGDADRAIADFSRAIELNPNLAVPYTNRGISLARKGEWDLAIADHTIAIALDPEYADAFNNRGSAYARKGDHDGAIADFTQAIALNPALANAWYNRAIAHEKSGGKERAVADLRKVLELRPGDKDAVAALKRLGVGS